MNRIIRADHKRSDLVAAFKQLQAVHTDTDKLLTFGDVPHTDPQRRLLWATWRTIADHVAEQSGQRFTDTDIHDHIFGEMFGWLENTLNGKTISRPSRTITKPKRMSKETMSEVIMATDEFAARHGCAIRVPVLGE